MKVGNFSANEVMIVSDRIVELDGYFQGLMNQYNNDVDTAPFVTKWDNEMSKMVLKPLEFLETIIKLQMLVNRFNNLSMNYNWKYNGKKPFTEKKLQEQMNFLVDLAKDRVYDSLTDKESACDGGYIEDDESFKTGDNSIDADGW